MYDNFIMQFNKEDYIPRDKFIRYLTKLFLRNNLQAAKKITNEIATELGITEFDFFDVAYKATYATCVDFFGNKILTNETSILDFFRNHVREILI